jgi:Ca2+-transporting ATPase
MEQPKLPDQAEPLKWHALPLEEVLATLDVNPQNGLSDADAASRLEKYGRNELRKSEAVSPLKILLSQFKSLVIWVLIGAGAVSAALQEFLDGIAIIAIVILNAALGFFQEYRAEKAAAALARMTAPRARVLREGHARQVAASEIVPGDILLLDAGDLIPADARLIEASFLQSNEAPLTGESTPLEKQPRVCAAETGLAERSNMLFLGGSITAGSGRAVATATGMSTEVGGIAKLLETTARGQTPLQARIDSVGKKLLYACVVIVGLVFVLGVLRSVPLFELFLTAVSLAVAAIPEGLPAAITIALAIGMQRMARRHALVRRLPAVETLGCAEVICTDKTGTLTVGEMTARRLATSESDFTVTGEGYQTTGGFFAGGEAYRPQPGSVLSSLLEAAAACTDAELITQDGHTALTGDPTEGALLAAAAKAGLTREAIEREMPRLFKLPFDSDRKRMTIVRRRNGETWAFVKGAPEEVLARCARVQRSQGADVLTQEDRISLAQANTGMAHDALRVLAVACRALPDVDVHTAGPQQVERDLTLLGLIGLQDPPRPEARDAVARCKQAGIRTVMITGDHRETGRAIAQELGILEEGMEVLVGSDVDAMHDGMLRQKVRQTAVYARVTALHKLRIVRAWKSLGAVVAMTGDGVNDAPALKEASIGVAMGITGTEVTKEAADIIITDDNFASIVSAVEEGRGIYDNIAKTLGYLLAGNTGELLVMLAAAIAGWPLPLLPIQLLWINLVTDGLPALALATDPVEPGVLSRPPRRPDAEMMDKPFVTATALTGLLTAIVSLVAFAHEYYAHGDTEQARNAAFSTLVVTQLLRAFGARSDTQTIFGMGIFSNARLFAIVTISLLFQVAIHHTPALSRIFGTAPISWSQGAAWGALGCVPFVAMELRKVLVRR